MTITEVCVTMYPHLSPLEYYHEVGEHFPQQCQPLCVVQQSHLISKASFTDNNTLVTPMYSTYRVQTIYVKKQR